MAKIAVIGIGNPFRGDDGAGWAVIDALAEKISAQIELKKNRGEIGDLLDSFDGFSAVYLIDACVGDLAAGSWRRLDALKEELDFERPQTSTHGLSIREAISLAKTLDQLPPKLIVYAIYGESYSVGGAISPKVLEAIPNVAERILNEEDIRSCMKKA